MPLSELLTHIDPAGPEAGLARSVNYDRLPRPVAVIMDGNGRWAAERHLPRVEGHRAGIESVRDTVESSARIGEDSKVAMRNVRRDANDKIKKLEKEHELSEDDMRGKQDAIQKLTDQFVHRVDEAVTAKEKDILEI